MEIQQLVHNQAPWISRYVSHFVGYVKWGPVQFFYSETLLDHGIAPLPMLEEAGLPRAPAGYPLRLGAAKIVAFCHSQHRNLESLRRLMPDPLVELAPETAAARGITDGEWVRIRTAAGSAVAKAKFSRDLAPGTVCAQHGWWVEGPAGSLYGAAAPLAANPQPGHRHVAYGPGVGLHCAARLVVRAGAH